MTGFVILHDRVDVNDHNEINGSVQVKSCFKLVYELGDFCSYRGVHVVRV